MAYIVRARMYLSQMGGAIAVCVWGKDRERERVRLRGFVCVCVCAVCRRLRVETHFFLRWGGPFLTHS